MLKKLDLLFLGPPRVERDGVAIGIRRRRVLALLAYLAVTGRPHGRDELAEVLCPHRTRAQAYAGLRQCLSYLRKAIGDGWIDVGARDVELRREPGLAVDVLRFRQLLAQARRPEGDGVLQATRLYRGDFLSGFYLRDSIAFEQWQMAEQDSLRFEYAQAVGRRAESLELRGDFAGALDQARALVALDPLDESSERRLMRLFALAGRRSAALEQYGRCRELLARELQQEPDAETQELVGAIRSGRIAPSPRPPRASGKTTRPSPELSGTVTVLLVRNPAVGGDPEAAARRAAFLARWLQEAGGVAIGEPGGGAGAAFADAPSAAAAAIRVQLERDPAVHAPRIVIHAGMVRAAGEGYAGHTLNRALSLLRTSHEGQILVSGAAAELLRADLPPNATLKSLGPHLLDDLGPPMPVFRLAHPELPSRFPQIRTLDSRRTNLRSQSTLLVGREKELALVMDLLRSDEVRLLTLTGPGGTGKTRVAVHAAARLFAEVPGGLYVVDLAVLHDSGQVVSAMAAAIGLREAPGEARSLLEMLSHQLSRRRMLLVLDNFEHLMTATGVVTAILAASPGLKLLVTSREPLHLQAEHEHPVPPMQLPPSGAPLRAFAATEAVRLFVERAEAACPEFVITDDNAPVVAGICARLDGLPLAIELAAARIKVLPPAAILQKLSSPLELLTTGAGDLPGRQRTLRSEFGWSYELLSKPERILFRRLGVFPGGCTVEAAASVCGADLGLAERDILNCLAALVDKSLLRRQPSDGDARFSMLRTIREFALEELGANNEASDIEGRFADWEVRFAEAAAPGLLGPEQGTWIVRLDEESDNLAAALTWLHATGRAADALRMAGALGWYWFRGGRFSTGLRWLEKLLADDDAAAEPACRARAFYYLGWMRLVTGSTFSGNPRTRACFRESLSLSRTSGDGRLEALSLAWLSWYETGLPLPERHSIADQGVAVARRTQDPWTLSFCLKLAHSYLPRPDETVGIKVAALEEAIASARRTGDPFLICQTVHGMGDIHYFLHDHATAEPWFLESLELARTLDDAWSVVDAQWHLGQGCLARGELDGAKEWFAEGMRGAAETGALTYVGMFLVYFATIAKRESRPIRALRLGGAASALQHGGQTRWYPKLTEGTDLPRGEVEREWSAGAAMSVEQAIEYALMGDG